MWTGSVCYQYWKQPLRGEKTAANTENWWMNVNWKCFYQINWKSGLWPRENRPNLHLSQTLFQIHHLGVSKSLIFLWGWGGAGGLVGVRGYCGLSTSALGMFLKLIFYLATLKIMWIYPASYKKPPQRWILPPQE